MPPTFQREGIDAAREVRRRHPGTGIVILSQYEEPEFAVSLLSEGAAGIAYLLKDRVAEGDQLVRAVREVSAGGSTIDPRIVERLLNPVRADEDLSGSEEILLRHIAEGRPIKAIAVAGFWHLIMHNCVGSILSVCCPSAARRWLVKPAERTTVAVGRGGCRFS
jgi:adenylate cyclase